MSTEILTSLCQNTTTHISNGIHKWIRCKRLVNAPILNALWEDWFTKLLLPKISCDVAMSGVVTKEDVTRCAQHLHLIYSQSSSLYDIIPQAPCPSNDKPQSAPGPHVDDMISFVFALTVSQVVIQLIQLAIIDNPASTTSKTTLNTSAQSTNVNLVQTSKTSRWKNCNERKKNAPIE